MHDGQGRPCEQGRCPLLHTWTATCGWGWHAANEVLQGSLGVIRHNSDASAYVHMTVVCAGPRWRCELGLGLLHYSVRGLCSCLAEADVCLVLPGHELHAQGTGQSLSLSLCTCSSVKSLDCRSLDWTVSSPCVPSVKPLFSGCWFLN